MEQQIKPLTLGSLFSRSGGFELGGLLSGITPVWNSDVEPFHPHSDSAEYRMWENGVALPCVCFVLAGIVWTNKKRGYGLTPYPHCLNNY